MVDILKSITAFGGLLIFFWLFWVLGAPVLLRVLSVEG